MAEWALETEGLTKRFGALVATDALSLRVAPGSVHALIGPNGAGKTTAIGQLAGEIVPDAGTIRLHGADITRLSVPRRVRLGLARSYQITSLFPDFTAAENVAIAAQARQDHSFRFWAPARRDAGLRAAALCQLDRVGLAGQADTPVHALAHGAQRQLEIAVVLAAEPSILLLDEPMAGMGQEETAHMVDILRQLKGSMTILLVEHDMDVVFALADTITVLVKGSVLATGTPDAVRADERVRAAYLGES